MTLVHEGMKLMPGEKIEQITGEILYYNNLVGMATLQEFDDALAAVLKGPLPPAALDRLAALRRGFAGEPR